MTPLPIEQAYLPNFPVDRSRPIGCIGSGFIMADCHLPAYRQAGFNPIAIASRTVANAQVVAQRHDLSCFDTYQEMLCEADIEVVDVAVPPDEQLQVIRDIVEHADKIKGILAQKPLGIHYEQACEIVTLCSQAGIVLSVNQNMRYDQSVRTCKYLLDQGMLGDPVFASIDMRAVPHWMPWQQRLGWVTLRIMSIHHLDTLRYWLGDPERVFCSFRPDPRTSFEHQDGICLYILEYESGARASCWDDVWTGPAREGAAGDMGIHWRLEGTTGMARGTIGWPDYPKPTPSTLDYTTINDGDRWISPRWNEVWFPDAFAGTMAQLLVALETETRPLISAADNLMTMALVEACYLSAAEHRAVTISEIHQR
ncbi:MAG TPA: Gfo/Idh/MocA family oxidoreductase [Planctomycetaceae bacterium]|nr:Gfo/Idh/MocA family oxidoreductase [Planctomycetaceae bacterium]